MSRELELIGRQTVELANKERVIYALLGVLADVQAGRTLPPQLDIDVAGGRCTVLPHLEGPEPGLREELGEVVPLLEGESPPAGPGG